MSGDRNAGPKEAIKGQQGLKVKLWRGSDGNAKNTSRLRERFQGRSGGKKQQETFWRTDVKKKRRDTWGPERTRGKKRELHLSCLDSSAIGNKRTEPAGIV